ncbi:MAG: transglycosylase domain-containing protein [Nannocystaceae bacterium]
MAETRSPSPEPAAGGSAFPAAPSGAAAAASDPPAPGVGGSSRSRDGGGGGAGKPPPPRPGARVWITNPARGGLVVWLLRYYLFAVAVGLVVAAGATVWAYRKLAEDLPTLDVIEDYASSAPGVTHIYAADGTLLAELAREHRAYADYDDIPKPLIAAILASEDRRFFEHAGLDVRGLARAALANLRSVTVSQGGSTITQQVAKGFLSHEQTLLRKLREAILSVRIEARLPKEKILEIYLNKTFFGHNAYGVASAASRYFGKSLSELTLAECALIAGLARTPGRDSPFVSLDRAKNRRAVVLQDMVEAGAITAGERDVADAEPIALASQPEVFRARAPFFAEHARQLVTTRLGEDALLQDGLRIETALELPAQAMADRAVDNALRDMDRRQGYRGPISHLAGEDARTELRTRLRQRYGADPLAADVCVPAAPDDRLELDCPNEEGAMCTPQAQPIPTEADCQPRFRMALVERVNKFNAWVSLGDTEAILPLRQMNWASRYDRNTGVNDKRIDDVRDALEPGDVVWVRRAPPAKRPQPGNEDVTLPEVELGQTPRVEAAIYTFDHQTGYAFAMQGGHDYDRSQFNRTTQGCRQPGSVFKAIYYALALDTRDFTMGTVLEDRPYQPDPGEAWNPQNLHGTLSGEVLLRNAFIFSLNLPSIRLFNRLGAANVVAWARKLGFTTELIADKALSLGASCVHTDELSRAFGTFVREGRWVDPIYVRRVTDKNGNVVIDDRHPWDDAMDVGGRIDAMARLGLAPPDQRVDVNTAFLITKMMRDVVTNGIAKTANKAGVPAGGKSGTASKNTYTTDTWFVGFTSRYVTAAWMGDDTYERSLGDEDASYTTATPMWTDFMRRLIAGIPHRMVPVRRPAGVRPRLVEWEGGESMRTAMLYFATGT